MKFDSLDSSFVCTRFHQVPSNRILTKLALRFHSCSLSVHCEFSRIVCVSLFSYQGSLFVCLSDSLFTLPHIINCVKYFFEVFYFFKTQNLKRRRRDLNPRAAINDLLPFQGSPFGQLGYFSKLPYAIAPFFQKRFTLYRVVFYLSRTFLTFQKFFILFK